MEKKNKIILTGDIHANISYLLKIDDENMTKDDIVIVLGDFGVLWEDTEMTTYCLEVLGKKNFTTAFVDGNHENFELIKKKENVVFWNDGYVGILPGGILHLLRGEIYTINGKRIGVCGGANSVDKWHRIEGLSWWKEEEITDEDIGNFEMNLARDAHIKGNKIDIMLSHDAPANIIPIVKLFSGINDGEITNSQKQLEKINQMADINKWYFGHWHTDRIFGDKFECLYHQLKEV